MISCLMFYNSIGSLHNSFISLLRMLHLWLKNFCFWWDVSLLDCCCSTVITIIDVAIIITVVIFIELFHWCYHYSFIVMVSLLSIYFAKYYFKLSKCTQIKYFEEHFVFREQFVSFSF